MTDASKVEVLRAFLAREGLALVSAEGSSHPEGADLTSKLLDVIQLIQDFQLIPPVEVEEPDAWDDAITLEMPRPGNTAT